MPAIISVENLGKRYLLRHQARQESAYQYLTLREEAGRWARGLFRRSPGVVRASREEFWALKDVSFEIAEGEAVGIIGRNGAGKSTLLKILSRITEPSEGRATLRGRVASLLEVGTGFHPELTGRENIFLNGAILGMTRAEIRGKFDEIVAFAGVERFLDTPVKRFSSGMYVRLAFAVAAHLEPEILIVDEVLAVGDAEFQAKCLGKMRTIAGEGRTVLFVSHNLGAVQSLCSSVLQISEGRVKAYSKEVTKTISEYLAGKDLSGIQFPMEITDYLTILQINCTPTPALNGETLRISLEALADQPIRVTDLALLIHDLRGNRCTILDGRAQLGLPANFAQGVIRLDFHMPKLSLVPADYHIGLYVRSNLGFIDNKNLFQIGVQDLTVSRHPPYESKNRGVFRAEFAIQCTPPPGEI